MAEQTESRRHLFTLFGIPFTTASPLWQLFIPALVVGIIAAVLMRGYEPIWLRLIWGVIYGALVLLAFLLHGIGHIIGSKMAQPPMTEIRITPLWVHTLYAKDPARLPAQTQLRRALGGPLMSLVLFVFALILRPVLGDAGWFFALVNLIYAVVSLLPIPTMDGAIIWREVERFLNQ